MLARRLILGPTGFLTLLIVVAFAMQADPIQMGGFPVPYVEATQASALAGESGDPAVGTPCSNTLSSGTLKLLTTACLSSASTSWYPSNAVVNEASINGQLTQTNLGSSSVGITLSGKGGSVDGITTLYDVINVSPSSPQVQGDSLWISPNFSGDFSFSCISSVVGFFGVCTESGSYSLDVIINGKTYSTGDSETYNLTAGQNQDLLTMSTPVVIPFTSFNQPVLVEFQMDVSAALTVGPPSYVLVPPTEFDGEGTILGSIDDPPTIELLNAEMQPVGATITSYDGINYTASPVPEPNSAWLIAAMLIIGAALRMGKRTLARQPDRQ
jgi:hypothetical protein